MKLNISNHANILVRTEILLIIDKLYINFFKQSKANLQSINENSELNKLLFYIYILQIIYYCISQLKFWLISKLTKFFRYQECLPKFIFVIYNLYVCNYVHKKQRFKLKKLKNKNKTASLFETKIAYYFGNIKVYIRKYHEIYKNVLHKIYGNSALQKLNVECK